MEFVKMGLSAIIFLLCASANFAQHNIDFYNLERHAYNSPKKIEKSVPSLSRYLVNNAKNDFEKVWVIYFWIKENIKYDLKAIEEKDYSYNYDGTEILRRGKAVCTGFSNLFKEVCTEAGIEVWVVDGYSKQSSHSNKKHAAPDHAWNVVLIDEAWYLLDVTWGKGTSKSDDRHNRYFLVPPEYFIRDHLPSLKMWQLLQCPISMDQFKESNVDLVREELSDSSCYSFQDTIKSFLSLNEAQQRLYRDQRTYINNKTQKNKILYGHAIIDYAGILSDSLQENLAHFSSGEVIEEYDIIVKRLQKAEEIVDFYPWQKELYASSLTNLVLSLYQQEISEEDSSESTWSTMKQHLEKTLLLISQTRVSYYTEQIREQALDYLILIDGQLDNY